MARSYSVIVGAIVLLVTHAALAAEPAPNTLSDAEKQAGFKLLFDGSAKGWRQLGGKELPKGWDVDQDALHHKPKGGGGDITTDGMFENFELIFHWKIAKGGNSGLKYRVQEQTGKSGAFGIEYQLVDMTTPADNKGKHAVASLYDVFEAKDPQIKPAGEWNESKIIVKGNHIEHWLNGAKTVDVEYGSDAWKAAVAKSKFKGRADFANPAKGHIILQDHGDEIWVRSIKIREL